MSRVTASLLVAASFLMDVGLLMVDPARLCRLYLRIDSTFSQDPCNVRVPSNLGVLPNQTLHDLGVAMRMLQRGLGC